MLVGLREMFQGIFHFWDEHISADGAWWILALDSVLLIPLIFALFFYPMVVLAGVGAVAVLTLGGDRAQARDSRAPSAHINVRIVRTVRIVRVVPVRNVRTFEQERSERPNDPND